MNALKKRLADQGLVARDAYDLILARFGLDIVGHPRLRSVLIDLVAFPYFLRYVSTRRGLKLLLLAARLIIRDASGFLISLNLGRNLAKRIGVHSLLAGYLRESRVCDFAVCDEGTVHIAHNLFVHTEHMPDPREIAEFANIVPMPDILIWVRTTKQQSIECIVDRGHSRVDDSIDAARKFVDHGHYMFDILCSERSVREKLFTVDNPSASEGDRARAIEATAEVVAGFLRESFLIGRANLGFVRQDAGG